MDKWSLVHKYRRAVANGQVAPIVCPECSGELVTILGREMEPAFRCLSCRVVYHPGLAVWTQIELAVRNLR